MVESSVKERSCGCKVGRTIDYHQLDDLDEELVRRRRNSDASLRDLAEYVNRRVLERSIANAERTPGAEEALFGALDDTEAVAAIYEALEGDDVSPDRRARVRTRLGQAGVDVEDTRERYITHTTLRHHLNRCLDVDTARSETIDPDGATDTIEWIRTRCRAIVERTLERLHSAGELDTEAFDVSVSVRVTCTECGRTFSPGELVASGGCECSHETPIA